jgi:hypothetical protein
MIFVAVMLCAAISASAEVTDFMLSAYKSALSRSGRSDFDGYCGMCVNNQLCALGINTSYIGGNGNQVFDNYVGLSTTSGGYTVNAFSAEQYSLNQFLNIVNDWNTNNDYTYIALGFQKGSATYNGQTYGHTLMIYSVHGGFVYFTESYEHSLGANIKVKSIDEFCNTYRDKPATSAVEYLYEGAVWFTSGALELFDTQSPTIYDAHISRENSGLFTVECGLWDNKNVDSVWMKVYGPCGESEISVPAQNGNFEFTFATADVGGEGVYSLHIYASDKAGNTSEGVALNDIHATDNFDDYMIARK